MSPRLRYWPAHQVELGTPPSILRLMDRFAAKHGLPLRRAKTEILQVNVGKLCNLTCVHCHVTAGPKRKEIMTREMIDRVI